MVILEKVYGIGVCTVTINEHVYSLNILQNLQSEKPIIIDNHWY